MSRRSSRRKADRRTRVTVLVALVANLLIAVAEAVGGLVARSLLAAVGIFVMGGCFSFFQGFEAPRNGAEEDLDGYVAGMIVLGVALVAEGASLLRALHQMRNQGGAAAGPRDPALRTVVAEDSIAVLG
ncbi:hypothetical protein [Streptomyces dysideae]|uniref:hypothetical protein n=1 Tax=Streptomyces dysideae TaxID=909626 RepID=UPI000A7F964B